MPKEENIRRTKKKRRLIERIKSPWIVFVEKCMERDRVKLSEVVNSEKYRQAYYLE
jgi:hypothetical protein|tara:strand:+ start:251 stop:418 length:168 start_codon:yes stop_codon:yes gene_type:complete